MSNRIEVAAQQAAADLPRMVRHDDNRRARTRPIGMAEAIVCADVGTAARHHRLVGRMGKVLMLRTSDERSAD